MGDLKMSEMKFGINPKYKREFELNAQLEKFAEENNSSAQLDVLWEMFQNRLQLDGWRKIYGAHLTDNPKDVESYTDTIHVSPPSELDYRASQLAVENDISYEQAIAAVLENDPYLSAAYTVFDPQQHFKEWLSTSPVGKDLLHLA
jgi:hypothetical protein